MTAPLTIDDLNQAFERFSKGMDGKFKSIGQRFDSMDERFNRMDERFDGMDERFNRIDERLDDHERRLDFIYVSMSTIQNELTEFKDRSLKNHDLIFKELEQLHQENLMRDHAIHELQKAS